jgi:two-component system OmpR family sensor kinase
MPLHLRLIGATLLLTSLGFAAAGFATYRMVESFLLDRFDRDLAQDRFEVFKMARDGSRPGHGRPPLPGQSVDAGGDGTGFLPVGRDTYAEIRDAAGNFLARLTFGAEESASAPDLPNPLPVEDGKTEWWFTTGGRDGGPDYRVYVGPANPGGELIVVAAPLTELRGTLDRLLLIEAGVSVAALAVIAGLGYVSVRLGLRPLDRVVETADAIAGGDLSRRVRAASPRTEVGRLGAAFNAMLGTIEESFARREASEQKLRRFVADASHELRTPLTSLKGYAEMLERPSLEQVDREAAVRRIEEAAGRMARLVDDMLLLARLDEEPALQVQRVDLAEIVAGAVADAQASEPERPIVLLESPSVFVDGDRDHLARAVANLLANVRMHTRPDVTARARTGVEDGRAYVEVSDDGPGIPPDLKEKLFERFFRADRSRTRASGGAGLGLSIVASIAEAHEGSVSLETAPGPGATFRIWLPLAAPPPPAG